MGKSKTQKFNDDTFQNKQNTTHNAKKEGTSKTNQLK